MICLVMSSAGGGKACGNQVWCCMKGRQRSLWGSRPLRCLALAACCALGFSWFWNAPSPTIPAASAQPDVRNAASREAGISRDSTVLARRMLQWQSKELLLDERRLDRLGAEIGTVLRVIRDRYPAMGEIAARQPPTELLLEIEGALLDVIAERWTDLSVGAVLPTGHAAFDGLSARLGLRTVEFWPASSAVYLRFTERVNLRAAVEAYSAIAGVARAQLDRRLIDGSDIAMRNMNGVWYVVMRKAWGDCPSGCINEETYFFTVKSGRVERIEENTAREMTAFRMLEMLAMRGW